MLGHNGGPLMINDQQSLTFVAGEAYRINAQMYETKYPDWDFGKLVFVDTTGPAWSPGVVTYTSDFTGAAKWMSGYAKDVPMADVSTARELKKFHLAAIGYQYNIEEVNAVIQHGGRLEDRRARAARLTYMKYMFDITLRGDTEKGLTGLINYTGVNATAAPADGTGSARHWVNNSGVGTKTPSQISRDINLLLTGIANATYGVEMADTLLMPLEAFNYLASTQYSATNAETVLQFIMRANAYTAMTGRPLTVRVVRELRTASTATVVGGGRLVAYKNDPEYVKLHLPMPHQFLEPYRDGPLNWAIPGIFRTGGVEMLTVGTIRYLDGILEVPA